MKQCGSRSDRFVRSQLIRIDSVFTKGKFLSAGQGLNHSRCSFVDIWDTVWSLLNTPALLTVETRSGGHPQSGRPCGSWSDGFVISQLIWIQRFHKKDKSGISRTRVRGYIQCGIYSRSSVYNISWSKLSGYPYLPLLSVNAKTLCFFFVDFHSFLQFWVVPATAETFLACTASALLASILDIFLTLNFDHLYPK